jgi:hypothetical protein
MPWPVVLRDADFRYGIIRLRRAGADGGSCLRFVAPVPKYLLLHHGGPVSGRTVVGGDGIRPRLMMVGLTALAKSPFS